MNKEFLSGKSVFIASYAHIKDGVYTTLGGPALAIKEYLKERCELLMCVWQPLPISDTLSVIQEVYSRGNLIRKRKFYFINWPFGREKEISFVYVLTKLRDILGTFYFAAKSSQKFNIFIGVESLDALIGVLLRRIGVVRKVVYYNLDYGEMRFTNSILNFIFHYLDKIAVNNCDYTWNLCDEMAKSRQRKGILNNSSSKQMVVPIGIDTDKIKPSDKPPLNRVNIAYLGVLSDKQGVQLIVEAMPIVVAKHKNAKFYFIGSGPIEQKLKNMVNSSGLDSSAVFSGLVNDQEVADLLCDCNIGIAPYFPDFNSTKKFTDPTKPKMYFACGLPVIITRVPPIASEIENNKCGIAINYDKKELAEAIFTLVENDELYSQYRKNAISFSHKFKWSSILDSAFNEIIQSR